MLMHVLWILSALLVLPAAVLLAEVVLAVSPRTKGPDSSRQEHSGRPRVAVLVPAHNEATSILGTLRSIAPQLSSTDRLVVIADNCVDRTAALAAGAGCEVVIRNDEARRGKGYALDAGVQYLRAAAPEVVIMLDADSRIATGLVEQLARHCLRSNRPVQARYRMLTPPDPSLRMRIAAFAWQVKNELRPCGLHRWRLPCQLMGSGMAFPWTCISAARLASGHIVEDLALGIELALRGYPALFCPQALVTSCFPESAKDLRSQHTRWEHGHLGVILSEAPRLLWQSLRRCNPGLLALALDLCVPPLALLALLLLAMLGVCVLTSLLGSSAQSLPALGFSVLASSMLVAAVALSWYHAGRRIVSFAALALSVPYAIWKLPLYLRFVVARQTQWVRSRRAGEQPVPHR